MVCMSQHYHETHLNKHTISHIHLFTHALAHLLCFYCGVYSSLFSVYQNYTTGYQTVRR